MNTIKKILVPNDFSVKSLLLLRKIIESSNDELDIVLLHGIHLSNSITDLLFFRKENYLSELCTKDFDDVCVMLKNKFQSKIASFRLDIITSENRNYFQNYLEANEIDEVFLPQNLELKFTGERSFNLIPLLKNCSVPVSTVKLPVHSEIDLTPAGRKATRAKREPILTSASWRGCSRCRASSPLRWRIFRPSVSPSIATASNRRTTFPGPMNRWKSTGPWSVPIISKPCALRWWPVADSPPTTMPSRSPWPS